jgi:hypothetical protein
LSPRFSLDRATLKQIISGQTGAGVAHNRERDETGIGVRVECFLGQVAELLTHAVG